MAALHICTGVAPALSAQDADNALVEWALIPAGGSLFTVLYPSAIASLIHLAMVTLEAFCPLRCLEKRTKSESEILNGLVTLRYSRIHLLTSNK